jgi:2-polyprenyl-6-methoxyphenol hydroxylase-like FAD-dependent oxidoreductase
MALAPISETEVHSMKRKHHVLVSGAGPAGLATALFLAERELDVAVIDAAPDSSADRHTVILHPDNALHLAAVGVDFDAREARRIDSIGLYDERHQRRAAMSLHAEPAPGRAVVVPLWLLCKKLEEALHARGVTVRRHHRLARLELADDRVTADVDVLDRDTAGYAVAISEGSVVRTEHHVAQFLIAADGRGSPVRTQLNAGWRSIGAPSIVVAFEVDTDLDLGHELRLIAGEGTAAMWSLPASEGTALHVAFRLPAPAPLWADRARAGAEPDASDLVALMQTHASGFTGRLGPVRWAHLERLEPGMVERPALGRAWFLGDAAHRLPPIAAHTLNPGVRAARDLATTLAGVKEGDALLSLVERAARNHVTALHVARIDDAYRPDGACDAFVAAAFRRVLPLVPAHGAELEGLMRQLGVVPVARP